MKNKFIPTQVVENIGLVKTRYQATDNGTNNQWNLSGEGNYWDDYDTEAEGCFDNDSNGICDSPYNIPGSAGSEDYFPSTTPFDSSFVQITDLIPIQITENVDFVMGKRTWSEPLIVYYKFKDLLYSHLPFKLIGRFIPNA